MDFRDAKALISAASENDVNSLRAVIERVSDADVRDEVGDTALMHATSRAIVSELIAPAQMSTPPIMRVS